MVTANPPLSEPEKLEFGNSTPHPAQSVSRSQLVIASYNIRYARGPRLISGGLLRKAGFSNFDRRPHIVARNIQTAAAAFSEGKLLPKVDVIAIQEADKRTRRAGGRHVASELAAALKMSWVHAPAGLPRGISPVKRQWWLDFEEPIGLYDEGDTGIALLGRLPLSDFIRIDLPWHECPWRPRLAMAATLNLAEQKIRLINVHVDPHANANGQLEQLEAVVAQADSSSLPTAILGDFNTLSQKKCTDTRRYLESKGFTSPFPTGTATWRGAAIRLHADWIFVRDMAVKRSGVAKPLNVSDHWPIWAEIALA